LFARLAEIEKSKAQKEPILNKIKNAFGG